MKNKIWPSFKLRPLYQLSGILLLCIAAYLFIVPKYSLWEEVGVYHLEPIFLDMYAVFSASDASKDGYNVYVENPYDPRRRVHAYPRPWLWLQYTGLTLQHCTIVSLITISVFLLMSVFMLRPSNTREILISSALMLSPAVMLGVERANNDLIVFIIVGFAMYFLACKINLLRTIACFLIYFASILKIYPIVTFILFVRYITNKKTFWIFTFFITAAVGVYILLTISDISYLSKTIPKPIGRFTFGALPLLHLLTTEQYTNLSMYLYGLIGLTFFVAIKFSNKSCIYKNSYNSVNSLLFLTGSLILIFCFFVNSNFDYRCIYFIMVLPQLFDYLKEEATPVHIRKFTWVVIWLLPMVVYNELFVNQVLARDWILTAQTEIILNVVVLGFYLVEHLCSWLVITILLAFSIDLLKGPILEKMPARFNSILQGNKT